MKVTNLDLLPHHSFRFRKMEVDSPTAMKALSHKKSGEAVLIRNQVIRYNPEPVTLHPREKLSAWQQLLVLPDPSSVTPKSVSRWAFFTGDNPFLQITSAGSILPMPLSPKEQVPCIEVLEQYSEIDQGAGHSYGAASVLQHATAMTTQVILAGSCALLALVAVVAMLPTIIERFG